MLPEEMWVEVFVHLEVFDLLKLKRVSKHWNRIITRVIERECKWYEKCVAEVPEDMWSSLLDHQTNPKISCENFHKAKIHSEIWMTMYRSWIGWNTFTKKSTSIEDIEIFTSVDFLFCVVTAGTIVAVGSGVGQILFYDISKSTTNPIYQIHHEAPIGDVVLCKSGSDVMAISYSIIDIRYWDLKTKKQIHQIDCQQSEIIAKSYFDYCYSLTCEDNTWTLNVEQFVSGTVRTVRSVAFTDTEYVVKAIEPGANKTILFMTSDESGNKFFVNLPDNSFQMITTQEAIDKEIGDMFRAHSSCFKIFKPCVATYIRHRGKTFALSVNTKPWKPYDVKQDLSTEGSVTAILYHVNVLMIAIKFDHLREAELRIYSIKNTDNLDNLDFTSTKLILKFTSPAINDLAVTEYNSHQYIFAVAFRKLHIVKFE